MQLPQWLINATGAAQFATNPNNAFQPTLGDAAQGIGHSMMEHYRRSMVPSGSQTAGVPGGAPPAAPAPDQGFMPIDKLNMPMDMAQRAMQMGQVPNWTPTQPIQVPPLNLQSLAGLFR